MRISDWSSDVCSSDLLPRGVPRLAGRSRVHGRPRTRRRPGEAGAEAGDHGLRTAGDDGTRRAVVGLPDLALRAAARAARDRAFPPRSDERRVGNAWVRTGRARWVADHETKKNTLN